MSELPILESATVALRPWQPSDAEALAHEIQDPGIVRWLNIDLPYTVDDARGFIDGVPRQWKAHEAAQLAIIDRFDGGFIGYLGVLAIAERMRAVEIVYWVAAAARGRGIASEAVRVVLPWITETIQPERIELGMVDGNEASARVAAANGFRLRDVVTGAACLDGAPADERIYEWTGTPGDEQ